MRYFSLAGFLFAFWLALSGHYTPMLVAAGAVSAVLCVLAAIRMRVADAEGHPIELFRGALTYFPWLAVEIAKSALGRHQDHPPSAPADLAHHDRGPGEPEDPRRRRDLRQLDHADARHDHGRRRTATSSPCTRCVREGALDLEGGGMDRRVSQFEGSGVMFAAAAVAILVALALADHARHQGADRVRPRAGRQLGRHAGDHAARGGRLPDRASRVPRHRPDLRPAQSHRHARGAEILPPRRPRLRCRGGARSRDARSSTLRAGRCILLGSFFTVVGAFGLVRMPEVFTRMHAASVTDTLGVGLLILGHGAAGRLHAW